jgi:hypothetical protein
MQDRGCMTLYDLAVTGRAPYAFSLVAPCFLCAAAGCPQS